MKTVSIHNHSISHVQRPTFWQDIAAGKWEPESFNVLDKYIQPGKIFIDIGAWIGTLSCYATALGAKTYSIEPDLICFIELLENIKANKFEHRITPSLLAIAEYIGSRKLNSRTFDGLGNSESSLVSRDLNASEVEVMTLSLSDYFDVFGIDILEVCLIKIDVEGGEVFIIKGAKEFLKKYRPTIFISFHPAWMPDRNKDIEEMIEILFPIYSFHGMDGKIADEAGFRRAMGTEHEHSFVLIGK